MTFDLHCIMKSETQAKVDEIADIKTQIEGIRKWVTENKAAATIQAVYHGKKKTEEKKAQEAMQNEIKELKDKLKTNTEKITTLQLQLQDFRNRYVEFESSVKKQFQHVTEQFQNVIAVLFPARNDAQSGK